MEIFENVKLYDWVPFFRELSSALIKIGGDNIERNTILKSKALAVFGIDHSLNKHDFIDPFSFVYSLAQKNNVNKREEIYEQVRISFSLTASIPSDTVFPSPSNNAKVCFYTNGNYVDREGLNIDVAILWETFDQAFQGSISPENFETMIALKGVRITKFSQVLFLINPEAYWSIDENSLWLPIFNDTLENLKASVEQEGVNRYLSLLETIQNTFPSCKFYEMNLLCWLLSGEDPQLRITDNYCQISSKLDGPDSKDYFDDFVEQNAVWTGGEGKHVGGYAVNKVKDGDIVLVRRGTRALGGIGIIILNEFEEGVYDEEKAIYIIWLNKEPKKLDFGLGDWKGFNEKATDDTYNKFYQQYKNTLDLIDRLIAKQNNQPYIDTKHTITINTNLMSPLNTILYGPPGTGKTYNTIVKAAKIITGNNLDYKKAKEIYEQLLGDQVEFITFHQNYSYEDFVTGLKPDTKHNSGSLQFVKHEGVFYKICKRARDNFAANKEGLQPSEPSFQKVVFEFLRPLQQEATGILVKMDVGNSKFTITGSGGDFLEFKRAGSDVAEALKIDTLKSLYQNEIGQDTEGKHIYYTPLIKHLRVLADKLKNEITHVELKNYVLIIDEINRANISRVFGELITLLEKDKRLGNSHEMIVTLSNGEKFSAPKNLYIIGTMNTADKSIALIDIALRRRFVFEDMYPREDIINTVVPEVYRAFLIALNNLIKERKGVDFTIGHAYFIPDEEKPVNIVEVLNQKIIPLLNEYFYNQRNNPVWSLLSPLQSLLPSVIFKQDEFIGIKAKLAG